MPAFAYKDFPASEAANLLGYVLYNALHHSVAVKEPGVYTVVIAAADGPGASCNMHDCRIPHKGVCFDQEVGDRRKENIFRPFHIDGVLDGYMVDFLQLLLQKFTRIPEGRDWNGG